MVFVLQPSETNEEKSPHWECLMSWAETNNKCWIRMYDYQKCIVMAHLDKAEV